MPAKVQFSLRWIFVAMALVAVFCGEAVAFPDVVAEIAGLLVTALLPCGFVSGIVYARGAGQAFCIGALVMWSISLWMLTMRSINFYDGGRVDFCILWSLPAAGGLVAVVVRWLTLNKLPREPE